MFWHPASVASLRGAIQPSLFKEASISKTMYTFIVVVYCKSSSKRTFQKIYQRRSG